MVLQMKELRQIPKIDHRIIIAIGVTGWIRGLKQKILRVSDNLCTTRQFTIPNRYSQT
jgi:hypothetical protein